MHQETTTRDMAPTAPTRALGGDHRGPAPGRGDERRDLVLDRYRLLERLGAGGFGVVWRAWDEHLEREVAVKVISRERAGPDWRRAEREARAAARLNHPGIVALYELGADDEAAYLVSEVVPGGTLAQLYEADAVSDRDVAGLGVALARALAHARERGVVHRDVKPQNVMVVAEPAAGSGFAKLADFGAASLTAAEGLTGTGDVIGTLAYMAPEQADGRPPSSAADLYSLALTLYEGFAGRNPVRGASLAETARRVGRPVDPLELERRDLPLGLCRAIDDALDPRPEVRGSFEELADALERGGRELSSDGGLEEAATLERFGLARRPPRRGLLARALEPRPVRADLERAPSRAGGLGARLLAGAGAGVLALVAVVLLGRSAPPMEPLAAAGVVGGGVALLPRAAWLAAAAALVVWLSLPGVGREGIALVLASALLPVPLLLPRAGTLWSVPALAVALGSVALGPSFPALAGLVPGPLRRAGLAAAGFVAVCAAEILTRRDLVFGPVEGTGSPASWGDSVSGALRDGLGPLLLSPALLPMLVWAAFAAVLPLFLRARTPALDLLGAAIWSAGLVAAHLAMADFLAPWVGSAGALGLVGGAVLGALTAAAAGPVLRRMAPR